MRRLWEKSARISDGERDYPDQTRTLRINTESDQNEINKKAADCVIFQNGEKIWGSFLRLIYRISSDFLTPTLLFR